MVPTLRPRCDAGSYSVVAGWLHNLSTWSSTADEILAKVQLVQTGASLARRVTTRAALNVAATSHETDVSMSNPIWGANW